MKASKYRSLLWELIAALDTGNYDSLSIEEVWRQANAGTISACLIDRFGTECDFSLISQQDWAAINEDMASLANAVDAQRKFGVKNRGISLLLAYTFQALQSIDAEERRA